MSWFGRFTFGALSGVVLSAAIAIPVIHYAENGGMAAVNADINAVGASIKDSLSYTPETSETSAEARAIRTEVENSRSQLIPSDEDFAIVRDTIESAAKEVGNFTQIAGDPNPFAALLRSAFSRRCGGDAFQKLSAAEKIRRRRTCEQAEKFMGQSTAWADNPDLMSTEDVELMNAIKTKNFAEVRVICRRPLTRSVNRQQSLRDQVCAAMLGPKN